MDSFNNGSVWYSKLESEVLLTDLYSKLSNFPESVKAKVVTSWLANSFADLTNSAYPQQADSGSSFVVHIKLVNNLVNNSSIEVAYELSDLFSNGFLYSFVKPSLLDSGQTPRNLAEATNYFQLVCENITQPLLIRKVVNFTIGCLLPTLVSRLRSNDSEVLASTLGLFRALLEFYCEDLWHELFLQYLLPMKHLLVSERQAAIPEINFQESTSKFIDMIPSSIYKSLSLETLSENFAIYIQQELQRMKRTDVTISATLPLSKSEVTGIPLIDAVNNDQGLTGIGNNMDKDNSRNTRFPLWVFKYDGTDVTYASRKYKLSEPEEYFEDDLSQFFNNDEKFPDIVSEEEELEDPSTSTCRLTLPKGPESVRFYAEPVATQMHIRPSPDLLPGTSPPSWKPATANEDQGYFGPFLEALFHILDKWTRLDPEVILTISDVFSVLVSSRIPLLSILLDFSVVLQPCYPKFHGIIHSIKVRIDGSLKKYPESYIQHEWKRATNSSANCNTLKTDEDLFQNYEEPANFAEALRFKILKSAAFSFANKSTTSKFAKLFGPAAPDKRILNSAPSLSLFEDEEQEIIARKSTLRCILFTHWMLELAAISQQSCWFQQSRQNQRQGEDAPF